MCLERNRLSMLVPWNTKHQRELNRNSRLPLSGNWVLGVVQPLPHPFNRAQTCGCHRKKLTCIFYSTYIFPLSICVMSHVSLSILHLRGHTCGSGRLQMWGGQGWHPPLLFHFIQWGSLQISSRTPWNGWPYQSACSGGFPVSLFWAEIIQHLHRVPGTWMLVFGLVGQAH